MNPQFDALEISHFLPCFHLDYCKPVQLFNLPFVNKGSLLTGAQLLGLAAFVVHLDASASHQTLVQLVPPISTELVNFGDAFVLALQCKTQSNMVFCVR